MTGKEREITTETKLAAQKNIWWTQQPNRERKNKHK
jgi:hypothetical protein